MSTALRRALASKLTLKTPFQSRQLHWSMMSRTAAAGDGMAKMKQRAIVSSFICTPADPEGGGGPQRFALFKRSQEVSTYRGKWAVCSGSIEPTDPTPEAAARREIEEETTLTSSDLSLLRRGRPFILRDEDLKTDWSIHPFAFVLHDASKPLTIEHEHTEYKLVTPSELSEYDTVPVLAETTRRVLPGPEIENALRALRDDHTSGATALATLALRTLRRALVPPISTATSPTELWRSLRLVAWTLAKNGRPAMAPAIEAALFAALERITVDIHGVGTGDDFNTTLRSLPLERFQELAATSIDSTIAAREERVGELAAAFTSCVQHSPAYLEAYTKGRPLTLLTLSDSTSVVASLAHLCRAAATTKTGVRILILESRPRFEGVAMARALLDAVGPGPGVEVEVLTDASVAGAVGRADFVVLGADKVGASGDVSNKTGSLAAAALAKTVGDGCKVVVVCCEEKIVGSAVSGVGEGEEGEENDASEVVAAWPGEVSSVTGGMKVRNTYFEWVPRRFVDVYVTESGDVGVEGVEKVARGRGELEERLFEDL